MSESTVSLSSSATMMRRDRGVERRSPGDVVSNGVLWSLTAGRILQTNSYVHSQLAVAGIRYLSFSFDAPRPASMACRVSCLVPDGSIRLSMYSARCLI